MDTNESKVARFQSEAARALDRLTGMFDVPMKATLLLRDPARPDHSGDMLISDDDPASAASAIRQLGLLRNVRGRG